MLALIWSIRMRSEEHTSELQSHLNLVCRLLLEKKKQNKNSHGHLQKQRDLGEPHRLGAQRSHAWQVDVLVCRRERHIRQNDFFFFMRRRPPRATLFPYTTLFR